MLNDEVKNISRIKWNIYIYIFYKHTTIKILFIHFEEVKLQTNCVINVIFNIRFLLMESAEKV